MEKTLHIEIKGVKGIKNLSADLPLSPGLYAITGKNGSGKSTLMAAIANIYYNDVLKKFFINSFSSEGFIKYELDDKAIICTHREDGWSKEMINGGFFINGFYEGSVIHGNRFRDTNYSALYKAARVKKEDLKDADPFVKKNLGLILHGNPDYYHNLFRLSSDDAYKVFKFRSYPYFLVNSDGTVVSQFSLSTGESLLVSILHSINYKIGQRKKSESTYLVLLDEIELALHPSALVRLLNFLREFSKERNVAVYFSTHSVELLRFIQAENIYYLEKHADTSVEVVNPCYPAYATRSIYSHDGYDLLIITEDELSMKIVDWLLRKNNLLSARLIHIIPAGGWENVISLHQDIVSNNVLGVGKRAISVLDGDVQQEFERKYTSRGLHRNLNVVFLPIKSAEKFLKQKLLDDVDHKFFRKFGDSFFRQKSLQQVIEDYLKQRKGEDSKGKALLRVLKSELKIPDAEFYTLLTNYIVENESMETLSKRLKDALD